MIYTNVNIDNNKQSSNVFVRSATSTIKEK